MNARPEGRAHGIAEGGLLAALSALVSIVARLLPVGGLLFHIAAAVPVVRVTARHGRRAGAATAAVVGLLLATVFGPLSGWNTFVSLFGFAVVLGWARRRGFGTVPTVLWAALGGALTVLVSIAESFAITGVQPLAATRLQLGLVLDGVVAVLPRIYHDLHIGANWQAWVAGWIALARMWLPTLSLLAMAAFVAAYGLGFATLLYAFDVAVARRLGDPLPRLPRLVTAGLDVLQRLFGRTRI